MRATLLSLLLMATHRAIMQCVLVDDDPCSAGPPGSAAGGLTAGAWPLFAHPRLRSTRKLELFRNQVRGS